MPEKSRCPVVLVRNTGGTGIKHIVNDFLIALSDYTCIEQIVMDARNELTPGSPGDFIVFTGNHLGGWLSHKIFQNRTEIFSLGPVNSGSFQGVQETYFVYGELSFSEDGTKIVATSPLMGKINHPLRIYTDVEILKYIFEKQQTRAKTIYWYYDS